MHIKSIHLDGFKSYQKHTDITGFSPQFNAITGYNGSGKSNVLDSICFILGINKLDNIRAKSMSELISHGGTKATVQIRFDNRDKTTSPYGMEQLDEITVQRTITAQATGKGCATSYILNGHAATNTRIQDFFRGIGLNVNNPHFLIMQGRITTVLNMKPEEILGMVEEAAGTKMYDQKKKEAEKTMYLKQSKLDEIDRIFDASIGPRMDKFREDRKNMIEATRLGKVKDNAARKLEAYQFYQASEATQRDIESMEVVKNEIEELNVKLEKVSAELRAKEIEKAALENMRDNPADEQNLSEAQRRKQAQALNLETEKNKIVDAISKLKKEAERTEKSIAKERKALDLKHKELEDTKAANNNDIQSHKNNEQAVETLRNELESLTRGTVANDKGEHVSVETMIQDTRSKAASLEAAIKTAGNRRDRAKNRLVQLEKELSDENSKSRTVLDNVKKHENDIAKLKSQMEGLGFDHEQHSKMHERHEYLKNRNIEIEEINTRILQETCYGRFSMVFTSPPIPGFDAKRDVIGLLIHCVTIKPGYEEYGAAIDVAAGGMVILSLFCVR
uniref:SMC_N domain-containing protein n=1 Tax=Caenorhabditis tropicalis TaxID=1561998 RepID=A0A1I7THU0_9PELO